MLTRVYGRLRVWTWLIILVLLGAASLFLALGRKANQNARASGSPSASSATPSANSALRSELLVRVRAGSTAEPLSGARASLRPAQPEDATSPRLPTRILIGETTRFDAIEPGRYELRVEHPGFALYTQALKLEPGLLELEVVLQHGEGVASPDPHAAARPTPGEIITGRVLTPEGEPVAGARVGSSDARSAFEITDADGRFELRGLGKDPVQLFATAPGYASARLRALTPGIRNVDLVLEAPAALKGALSLPPAAGRVDLSVCSYDAFFKREICVARRLFGPPATEYHFEQLSPGRYELVTELEGYPKQRHPILLEAGRTLDGPEVRLGP